MSDETELPTCQDCIYGNECAWASPDAHWSDCGIWGQWEQCPTCLGHGEHLAAHPTHPEDCQDYHVACSNRCHEGYVQMSERNPKLPLDSQE